MFNKSYRIPFRGGTGIGTASAFGRTFGSSTSNGGLSRSTTTTFSPFGSTSGSASLNFAATGMTVKFNPPISTDIVGIAGVSTTIPVRHQCISAMKEYQRQSLEELRLADYQANRKGPSNPTGSRTEAAAGSLGFSAPTSRKDTGHFGSSTTNKDSSYGQNRTDFRTSTTGFGAGTTAQVSQATSLFTKPPGQATTQVNTGFFFGNTSLGHPNASTMGLIGVTQPSQPGGLWAAATTTSAGPGSGSETGVSGQVNTGFGGGSLTLFRNKSDGSATTKTSSVSDASRGSKQLALVPRQMSFLGNTQPSPDPALKTGESGAPGFNTLPAALDFGALQPAVALPDSNASSAALQALLHSLTYSPYGDSPLFRNTMPEPKKEVGKLRPTISAAQKAPRRPSPYKLKLCPPLRPQPKALQSAGSAKSHLFDHDDDEPSLSHGAVIPRKTIKSLVLKNLRRSDLFLPVPREEKEGLAAPPEAPAKGVRFSLSVLCDESHGQDGEREEEPGHHEVAEFYTHPVAQPSPQTPESTADQHQGTVAAAAVAQGTWVEGSSEDAPFHDDSLQDELKEEPETVYHQHPAGATLLQVHLASFGRRRASFRRGHREVKSDACATPRASAAPANAPQQ